MTLEFSGEYVSKWWLTDFYPEYEEILRNAIESGEDFDTGWVGCKKEIRYMRLSRENGKLSIEVSEHTDDMWDEDDLIYDAVWKVTGSEDEIPEDKLDAIRDVAIYSDVDDHADVSAEYSNPLTFDEVVEIIDEMESDVSDATSRMFEELCDIVADVLGVTYVHS